MAEVGLAILIIGALIAIDRERLAWAAGKVRDLVEWLTT
jgi:hypothetical protein